MAGAVHVLKCHPGPFQAMKLGLKGFEFREDDRGYQVGDVLRLHEFDPMTEAGFTGDVIQRVVTYRLPGGAFGVPEGFCVLSVRPL